MSSNRQSTPTLVSSEHAKHCTGAQISDPHYAGTEELFRQFMRFARLMKRATSRFTAQHTDGIEQAAYVLLGVLATEGPQRTTALAEAVHSDTSTVSRQVGTLVRHGLVERRADPVDGRACLLAATTEGERTFTQQRQARVQQVATILADWSPDEIDSVSTALARLNGQFERFDREHQSTGATGATQQRGGTR
jgi:DNA-binding MarR family transcriptional regulator